MVIKHIGQRVGVLIDVQNMYYSAKNLFGAKVNFKRVVENALAGRKLIRAIAYDVEVDTKEKEAFLTALEKSGIEIRSKPLQEFAGGMKKGDWDVGLAMDAIKLSPRLDVVILVSGDGDFYGLYEYLQSKNKLGRIVVPNRQFSTLLNSFLPHIDRLDGLKRHLAYKKAPRPTTSEEPK